MPRKSLKTAPEAAKPADQGVDSPFAQWAQETPENEPPKKIGRPSSFSQHIADVICVRIAEGESLRTIVQDEGMPDRATIYRWLQSSPAFCDQYTRAREDQADTLADEIIAIADEQPEIIPVVDKRTGELIEHKLDGAFLQWQKNRIDARKWTAMKLKPKKYGDKITHAGDPEAPLQVNNDAMALLAAAVQNLELKRKA